MLRKQSSKTRKLKPVCIMSEHSWSNISYQVEAFSVVLFEHFPTGSCIIYFYCLYKTVFM